MKGFELDVSQKLRLASLQENYMPTEADHVILFYFSVVINNVLKNVTLMYESMLVIKCFTISLISELFFAVHGTPRVLPPHREGSQMCALAISPVTIFWLFFQLIENMITMIGILHLLLLWHYCLHCLIWYAATLNINKT